MRRVEFPHSLCRAGVDRVDITPPVGIYHRMWGAAVHDRSTGIHRPLTATVLSLAPPASDGAPAPGAQAPCIWIAVDHCLLWQREMDELLAGLADETGIDRQRLTVFFSHTHAAGLMGRERIEFPGGDLIPGYLNELQHVLAASIRRAVDGMRPAALSYATGRSALATNRDYRDPDTGRMVCGFNPDGPADDQVVVVRITEQAGGRMLGTVVNYACHPTTLAWDNTLISPDYPGAMREVVEGGTGAPCFFIQGASGDIGPRDGYVGDTAVADRNGRMLGHAVMAALESLAPPLYAWEYAGAVVSGATIGVWGGSPPTPDEIARFSEWQAERVRIDLPFRDDLPDRDALIRDAAHWTAEEQQLRAQGNDSGARDARAMRERARRRLTRVEHLPPGDHFPYEFQVWRIGDAAWVSLNGEHYNILQRALRARFSDRPLVIGTLANGSNVWYLPEADAYGRGLYQEEASILARGALEQLMESLAAHIAKLFGEKHR